MWLKIPKSSPFLRIFENLGGGGGLKKTFLLLIWIFIKDKKYISYFFFCFFFYFLFTFFFVVVFVFNALQISFFMKEKYCFSQLQLKHKEKNVNHSFIECFLSLQFFLLFIFLSQLPEVLIIDPPLVKTKKKQFPQKTLFFQICFFVFFPKNFRKIFFEKKKKNVFFFIQKTILCCPQKVTKFCSKKKKGEMFLRKNFFFCLKKTFFEKFFEKKKIALFLHENVIPNNRPRPSWKQGIFFSTRGESIIRKIWVVPVSFIYIFAKIG